MLNIIKKIYQKMRFGYRANSESYIEYLRKAGIKIGNDVTIYSPRKTNIDMQYPWMISIGDHVRITEGVMLITHDYSWSVLKRINPADYPSVEVGGGYIRCIWKN